MSENIFKIVNVNIGELFLPRTMGKAYICPALKSSFTGSKNQEKDLLTAESLNGEKLCFGLLSLTADP